MAESEWKVVFRVLGGFAFAFAMLCVVSAVAKAHSGIRVHDIPFLIALVPILIAASVGLFYLRKLAAILFAAPLLVSGLFLIVASIIQHRFPWFLIHIPYGIVLLLPAVATVRGWRVLAKWV